MRYGSICSGVEAASLAWRHLGWTPAFFSEVEPFPAAVLMQRLGAMKPLRPLDPDAASDEKDRKQRLSWQSLIAEMPDSGTIPNLGDFTLIKKEDYDGQIDLLVGGTPCQDLSIAGKRLGFGGKRSVLALDFVRLCFETGTRWVLWENVPAALSSRRGEDFGRFVSLLCGWNVPVPESGWRKCGIVTPAPGGFGVAWRVLDSQFTRVEQFPRAIPQRRKRLFLVGYTGQWKYPAKVLFDGEMCGGDTPPRRTKRQNASAGSEGGSASTDWWDGSQKAGTLTRTSDQQFMPDKGRLQCVIEQAGTDFLCYENHAPDSRIKSVEVSQSIVARMGTGGNNLPLLQEVPREPETAIGFIKNDAGGDLQGFWDEVFPTMRTEVTPAVAREECFHVSFCDANGRRKDRPNGGLYVTEAKAGKTVTAGGPGAETVIVEPIALDGDKMKPGERSGGSGMGFSEDGVMYTQTVKDVHAVAYDECVPLDLRNATRDPEKHDAQNRQGVGIGEDGAPMNTVTAASVPGVGWQATVRKLLPIECERLMGFPDNWTRISWKGKPEEECPDAPRYKACGNSMCVNVMAWIGERIEAVNQKLLQMK